MNANAAKPLDVEDLKRLRRMGRKMVATYEQLDPKVKKETEHFTLSCKAGCSGCCHLMTLVSLPEGVAIAEYFLEDTQRRQLIPLLMRSFLEQVQAIPEGPLVDVRQKYFEKKVPCTFLDPESKLCTIYAVRPSACRYHFVVSDPALCQPEGGRPTVSRVNTQFADAEILSEANKVSNQVKVPLFIAPLQVTMLWAFKLLIEGREAFETALEEVPLDALSLKFWRGALGDPEAVAEMLPPPAEVSNETPAQGSD